MLIAIILFVLTYVLMLALPKYRHFVALGSALLFLILGILPWKNAPGSVDWNVLMMIGGTMGLVSYFIASGMPALMADLIVEKMPNVKWTIIALSLFAGIISAFMDNVATVLMIAPVAMAIAKKFKINPVPMLIAIAVSSNLQGAATLVGDTTSIMLGGYANMDFLDFFWFRGRMGMFFVVELGALMTIPVELWLFRRETQTITPGTRTKVNDYFPSFMLLMVVLLLIGASFFPGKPSVTNGVICMALFVITAIVCAIRDHSLDAAKKALQEIDWQTLMLLFGLFLVIAGITEAGLIDKVAAFFATLGESSLFLLYTLVVWFSVLFSAFIDNIPYVATMLPVMQGIGAAMGIDPCLLYFGLLTGATLGGNLSPIGASANITAIGMLRRDGHEVKNRDFMRIGVPFSLAAVITGYVLIWFLWR